MAEITEKIAAIDKKINALNEGIKWIKRYDPEHYDQQFRLLVDERRKLKNIRSVINDNPAIAAYGVSQVGKSYLMNCMLQKNGKPFRISCAEKEGGYDFIEEMNPKTDNTEATGVVTRFTSFSRNPKLYSDKYPILMHCLSITDIVLVISDGYYNDLTGYTTFSEQEIKDMGNEIFEKYLKVQENPHSPLQPDNILDIKAYFHKHLTQAQAFIHTDFFDKVALVADRIPSSEWVEIFSILWHKTAPQTKLFKKIIDTLSKLKYAEYVYLPPEALLHNGINEATVISVQCLNQLFLKEPIYKTDVFLRDGETDNYTKIPDLTKSEVCAVCGEIIVKIDEDYLENASSYFMKGISDEVKHLLSTGEIKTDILRTNDMLDFPGARSRKKLEMGTMSEDSNLITVLLRGKVAYLFNMYNDTKRINILLYCHHQEKNEVSDIPLLLKDWIMNNIGATMEKRRRTMEMTDNISPLFYIGTKFNLDMRVKPEKTENNANAMFGRWQQRFKKTLYDECFSADATLDAEGQKIFLNWTTSGEHFSNSYVLRDYKFSGPKGNHLYEDERIEGKEPKMIMKGSEPEISDSVSAEEKESLKLIAAKEYYDRLRKTFIESEHVKMFFRNPSLAWDVAASINNDGALFIIENLSKVARKMDATRDQLLSDVITTAVKNVKEIMEKYYVSNDLAEILVKNIDKANGIFRELEFTCQDNPDFFGNMIQDLQLTEAQSFNEVHRLIPELGKKVHDSQSIKDYELIRKRCNNFEGCKNVEEQWNTLIEVYKFRNREQALSYFKQRGIEIDKILIPEQVKRKNSAIISDSLIKKWEKDITGTSFANNYAGTDKLDGITLSHLIDCICSTAKNVELQRRVEEAISPYVDVLATHNINEELVADIIATIISDFVMNFGYSYLTDELILATKKVSGDERLSCFEWIERPIKESYDEPEMTALLDSILSSSDYFTPAYEANYNKWLGYMYIAFIAHINLPDYNREANDLLGKILAEFK